MAIVQLRQDTEGRRYYRSKLAAGKTPVEALRALKRRLSDIVYRQMVADAKRLGSGRTGVGGDSDIQRRPLEPQDRYFGKVTPGPAAPQPRTPLFVSSC
jgi:hypothetical protein